MDSYRDNPLLRSPQFGALLAVSAVLQIGVQRLLSGADGERFITSAAWGILRGTVWGGAVLVGFLVYLARWKLAHGTTLLWRAVAWGVGPYVFVTWVVHLNLLTLLDSFICAVLAGATWFLIALWAERLASAVEPFYFRSRASVSKDGLLGWHIFMAGFAAVLGYLPRFGA